MGCFHSSSIRGHSSPVRRDQAPDPQEANRTPNRTPGHAGVEGLNRPQNLADRMIRSGLRAVHQEISALVGQIGASRAEFGASVEPIYQNAVNLQRRIERRMTQSGGRGPDDYRELIAHVRHDFNAISSIGSNSSRYFDRDYSGQL